MNTRDRMYIHKFFNDRCKCLINGRVIELKFIDIMNEILDNDNQLGIEATNNKEINKMLYELKCSKRMI